MLWRVPVTYWYKEWMDKNFTFLGGLNNDYENVRRCILNSGKLYSIEEVYSKMKVEEHR